MSCCFWLNLAVLGSDAKDPNLEFKLKGTGAGWSGERLRFDTSKVLPMSDFQVHFKFLCLALSVLREVGVFQVCYQTYPTTEATNKADDLIPYDRHVRSFQELVPRCDSDFRDYTFCFAPPPLYSNLAWRVLVATLTLTASGHCCGHTLVDCLLLTALT